MGVLKPRTRLAGSRPQPSAAHRDPEQSASAQTTPSDWTPLGGSAGWAATQQPFQRSVLLGIHRQTVASFHRDIAGRVGASPGGGRGPVRRVLVGLARLLVARSGVSGSACRWRTQSCRVRSRSGAIAERGSKAHDVVHGQGLSLGGVLQIRQRHGLTGVEEVDSGAGDNVGPAASLPLDPVGRSGFGRRWPGVPRRGCGSRPRPDRPSRRRTRPAGSCQRVARMFVPEPPDFD